MQDIPPDPEFRSAERLAFEIYLRTGRRLAAVAPERKFNPYHDPRNGQFTFVPGGPRSVGGAVFSDKRGLWKRKRKRVASYLTVTGDSEDAVVAPVRSGLDRVSSTEATQPSQYRPNPRARLGGNGGPPLNDPMTMTQAIPALQNAPAATIIAVPAEVFLDLTGPARAATAAAHAALRRRLISQITRLNPNYQYRAAGPPFQTFQGQITEINKLLMDRAFALHNIRGDSGALQVQVMRYVQARVDLAYADGLVKYEAGELQPRLSKNEAIGNHIDRTVRADLRELFNSYGIDHRAGPVQVVGRAYDSSKTPSKYVIPDAAVTNLVFDWSLQRKTPGTRQVRGFFNSDSRPDLTVIIRPSQLGAGHTYVIKTRRR